MIKNKLEKIIKATKEHTACSNRCVKNMLVLYMESPPNVLVACRRNQIDHGNDLFAAVHTKA
jgi:hypothetical protein